VDLTGVALVALVAFLFGLLLSHRIRSIVARPSEGFDASLHFPFGDCFHSRVLTATLGNLGTEAALSRSCHFYLGYILAGIYSSSYETVYFFLFW